MECNKEFKKCVKENEAGETCKYWGFHHDKGDPEKVEDYIMKCWSDDTPNSCDGPHYFGT